MHVVGISAFYHDSAAALVEDGRVVAAAQEERFSRRKNDAGFPGRALAYCLEAGGVALRDVDYVVFYDKPFLKFERLVETYLAFAPRGFASFRLAMPLWVRERLFQKQLLRDELRKFADDYDWDNKTLFTEHHQSHAASAFFPSPFERAAILTMDGVGEWATTSVGLGHGNSIKLTKELHFPDSLGLLYSAFTYYTGFKVNSDEYKVMGLAPYGEPKYTKLILDNLMDLKPDGTFSLDQSYFDYCVGLRMTNEKFDALFGAKARKSGERLTERHMDIAASIQAITEEVMLRLTRSIAAETDERNLCLAGGVALNCVANGKVLRDGRFEKIWIQPAAGDAGGAIGAALAGFHIFAGKPRQIANEPDGMNGAYLGPAFEPKQIRAALDGQGAVYRELDERSLFDEVTTALVEGKVVGWFQGRMEFGPRALGNRSILGDARSPSLQRELNLRIKYRESFRPFAPAVRRERAADYFELDVDSPYMLLVAPVKDVRRIPMTAEQQALQGIDKLNVARSDIPAVTHIDYSARVQTVHSQTNERFHALLKHFEAKSGGAVLVNTSFNIRDEPIVCSPDDAYRCFMGTEMDLLVVGNTILRKENQLPPLAASAAQGDALMSDRLLSCLKPPGTGNGAVIERLNGGFRCRDTGSIFPDQDGVPSLLAGMDSSGDAVTGKVKAFYEEHPFLNYDGVEDFGDLASRGHKSEFTSGLLEAIGYNKLILECGCGTGQLTQFLSLNNNHVLGIDLSLSSLKLAVDHKLRNGVPRSGFVQMNIFDLAVKDDAFDVVISSGVLHHTRDARNAFAAIVRKVKPGGIVVVGLYNRIARVPILIRSKLIRRKAGIKNPHETRHSIDEVMAWFRENGVSYLNSSPRIAGSTYATEQRDMFAVTNPGPKPARILSQISWLKGLSSEGALFVMIGRRDAGKVH